MLTVIPYIPESITVHLGAPDTNAPNVTVPFVNYVKNVASSEIYPTWEESALRANIAAIVSFALNRVYTEFYRSRGYPFDITSSTAYDQAFVNGRSFFENVSRLADELFDDYIRKQGFVEPLAAKFCNGTTVTCEGLSQWGSQYLATQGYNAVQILRSYYGSDIELVQNAPIRSIAPSYPGTPLRTGSTGPGVVVVQVSLNRISQNYPAIPKVGTVDGIYGPRTESSVRAFQEIFGLTADGIVGPATWYELVRLYVGVNALSELRSQGQQFYGISWAYPDAIQQGDTGPKVSHLQYMLAVLSEFIPEIPSLTVDGSFGPATKAAVLAAQRRFGLAETGIVGELTWDEIYDQFAGIEGTVFQDRERFPFLPGDEAASSSVLEQQLQSVPQTMPQNAVPTLASARNNSNTDAKLVPDPFSATTTLTQFPGRDLALGARDPVD